MDPFTGKLAVLTAGVGSGMGREPARQLAAQGCSFDGPLIAQGTGGSVRTAGTVTKEGRRR